MNIRKILTTILQWNGCSDVWALNTTWYALKMDISSLKRDNFIDKDINIDSRITKFTRGSSVFRTTMRNKQVELNPINKKINFFFWFINMDTCMRDYHESVTTGQTDRRTRTDGRTDRRTPDKVIPMCRYASQATHKQEFKSIYYMFQFYSFQMLHSHYQYIQSLKGRWIKWGQIGIGQVMVGR